MDLATLSRAISEKKDCTGFTLFLKGSGGWMVSMKIADGLRVFYGEDLTETVQRALDDGPQSLEPRRVSDVTDPDDDFDAGYLV